MPVAIGQVLSCYEILGPLGSGAMGEVWQARDTKLEREVAIKVLPEHFAADAERLGRFEREARSFASLNHPNVAQIFGVDQVGDLCFLVLEYVPGETLEERIGRGPLATEEIRDLGRQIAEGIEAAHEAGVIHRDLKPANVRITPDGKAKVLDFGLAKTATCESSEDALHESVAATVEGRLLGTPGYMAPEQARGQPIDRRVDVWAFGCVLFECLAARRAFEGATLTDVLARVVDHEPNWPALPASTPRAWIALLERCLDKDPRTRLQDIGEARIVLSRPPEAHEDPAGRAGAGRSRAAPILAAVAVGALAATALSSLFRSEPAPTSPLVGATFHRLTDDPGTDFDVDISPNGDFIAFGSDRGGAVDLWVAQIDGGDPVNLTQGRYLLSDDAVRNLGFTAHGSRAWCMGGEEHRLIAAPLTGGEFVPALDADVVNPDWTRDGRQLVYHTLETGDPVYVRGVDDPAGEPILTELPGLHQHYPVWSFDEDWIFLVRGSPSTEEMHLWRVRPDGSGLEQLTREQPFVAFPTPIDRDTVLFVANDADGSGPWLWSIDLPSRAVQRLTVGLEQYHSLAASADGRRVVATVANPKAELWSVPIRQEIVRESDASPLPGIPSLRALAPRHEGGLFSYVSSRGSGDGLWLLENGRAREIWSGTREPLLFRPSISPDGKTAALVRRQGERHSLSMLSLESGLTSHVFDSPIDVRGSSSWSPDGAWIVVGGIGEDGPGLFKFPSSGGPGQRILAGSAKDPVWSPTEDLIVYAGEQIGPWLPLEAVRSNGEPFPLHGENLRVHIETVGARWLPDGSGIVYLTGRVFTPEFWHLDLETGVTRPLTALELGGAIRAFDVTPDGESIVFDRIQLNSDIVLIDLDRSPDS